LGKKIIKYFFYFSEFLYFINLKKKIIIKGDTKMYNRLKEFTEKVILSTVDYLYFDCGTGN
jgi:hypothetical protein